MALAGPAMGALTTMMISDGRRQDQAAMDNRRRRRPNVQRDRSCWVKKVATNDSKHRKKRCCSDSMRRTGANAVLFLGESRRRGTDSTRKPYVSQRDLTTNTDTLRIRIPCRTREKRDRQLQTRIENHSGPFLCRWNCIRGISSAVSSRP